MYGNEAAVHGGTWAVTAASEAAVKAEWGAGWAGAGCSPEGHGAARCRSVRAWGLQHTTPERLCAALLNSFSASSCAPLFFKTLNPKTCAECEPANTANQEHPQLLPTWGAAARVDVAREEGD